MIRFVLCFLALLSFAFAQDVKEEEMVLQTYQLKGNDAVKTAALFNSLFTQNIFVTQRGQVVVQKIAFRAVGDIHSNNLIVLTTSDYHKQVKEMLDKIDVFSGPKLQTKIFKLNYLDASQFAPLATRILPTGSSCFANVRTNSLIVVAEQNRIDDLTKVISSIDIRVDQSSSIDIQKLRNANVSELSELIKKITK